MGQWLNTKFNSEFARNSLTIFSGNVIAQAIPFLAEPLLARLYQPKDFAVLAVYLSVANLFSIIATARYELAIMLPKEDRQAVNVLGLSVLISFMVSAVSFLIILLFNAKICKILHNEDVSSYLYLVPLSVLSVAWYQIFNYWNSRKKRFKNVMFSKTTQSVSTVAVNLGFAIRSLGLVLGQFLGFLFGSFVLVFVFWRKDKDKLGMITRREMKEVALQYQDFPKINTIHAFFDVLKQSGEVFLLSFFYLKENVGLHSRTLRLLFAPSSMIGSAVGQVFYQKASETYMNGGDLRALLLKVLKIMALIALPVFTLVAFFGDDLFAWFLGEPYRMAGYYGRFLAPWLFFNFITMPVSQIPLIVSKQKTAFLFSLCGHSLYLAAVFIGGLYHNILLGFTLLSIFSSLYYIFIIWWFVKISNNKKPLAL
ncbi:MAG: lipopolysaccharide biosynthesis protein [Bacteroidales bacterium]|jgi:O-antigen/teichoic acid export membrane protein|nr:lipopolysaccharide biosynthesis protein [Bacteroidales bacterium]